MSLKNSALLTFCILTLPTACASRQNRVGTTQVTRAEIRTSFDESQAAARDVTSGRFEDALVRADHAAEVSPANPWAHYQRAVALHRLGQTDGAVMAYREAESLFSGRDRWGKSISIYGRARALNDIGRCEEAKAAYQEYAGYVGTFDPPAANLALVYANDCKTPETPIGDLAMTELTQAIVMGKWELALSLADRVGGPAKESGWVDYNRGVALANLSRTNEAVNSYRLAENRFVPWDWFGRSITIYGRARALDMGNRCKEAKAAYEEYANLVRPRRSEDADAALVRADACNRLER